MYATAVQGRRTGKWGSLVEARVPPGAPCARGGWPPEGRLQSSPARLRSPWPSKCRCVTNSNHGILDVCTHVLRCRGGTSFACGCRPRRMHCSLTHPLRNPIKTLDTLHARAHRPKRLHKEQREGTAHAMQH